jgi:hypothetical protein
MNAVVDQADRSWFCSAAGLRFGVEVGVIVLAKLAVLVLLYVVFIVLAGGSNETAESAAP